MAAKVETYNKYADARHLDGAARAAARDDRLRLLLRRHACHARRPSPSGALLQGPARRPRTGPAPSCAPMSRPRRIEKTATGWRVLTAKGPIECREVVVATNGYTGDLTPTAEAPASCRWRATSSPPRSCRSMPASLIPEMRVDRRHQAGADLLPALARRQAADLRRPRALHRGAAGSERARALPLHDRPLPAARRHPHHPCVDRQRRLRARLHAAHGHRRRACTICWPATATASP